MPTPATNVRLTETHKATLEVIRAHYGLASVADAIRKAIDTQRQVMELEREPMRRLARSNRKGKKIPD